MLALVVAVVLAAGLWAVNATRNDQGHIVVAAGPGAGPAIRLLEDDGTASEDFLAFDRGFRGGVYVAGIDGRVVAGAGPGAGPTVQVFNSDGRLDRAFLAFDPGFRGGVHVAAGDVDDDGADEIVVGAGPGAGPAVRVFDVDGQLERAFLAFDDGFRGGVHVAAGDLDDDDADEIVVGAGPGAGPAVRVFDGNGQRLAAFPAFDQGFRGGVHVAVGDDRIVAGAGPGAGPSVGLFELDGTFDRGFLAFDAGFRGGVRVAVVE